MRSSYRAAELFLRGAIEERGASRGQPGEGRGVVRGAVGE